MQATHPSYQGAHPELVSTTPARQAYQALHIGFIVAPILAGLDKFTNLLTDWTQYLAPSVANMLPFSARTFMHAVGVVEIVAGLLVAVRPRIGGYVVSAWLIGIIMNLLIHTQRFYDVALRDLGLAIGAFALARLSTSLGKK
jgi:hypothetical protein